MDARIRLLRLCRAVLRPLRGRGLQRSRILGGLYDALYWRLAAGVVMTEVQGSRMFLDLRQSRLAQRLFMTSVHEPGETVLLRRLLRPGMVFADVGANVGYYTLLAARLVGPSGRIYAFEPDPACGDILRRSIQVNGYDHVIVVGKALAATPGVGWLSQPRNKEMQQLAERRSGYRCLQVEVTTLDGVVARYGGRLHLVKLDVEGAEPEVLRGMTNTLRRNPDLRIMTEFNPRALWELGTDPAEYLAELEVHGFELSVISPTGVPEPVDRSEISRRCPPGDWVNLLCEPRR